MHSLPLAGNESSCSSEGPTGQITGRSPGRKKQPSSNTSGGAETTTEQEGEAWETLKYLEAAVA